MHLDCDVSCTWLHMITFREETAYDEKLDVVLVLVFKYDNYWHSTIGLY